MNFSSRWLFACLLALASLFMTTQEAKAASQCAENGGLRAGCLVPTEFVWRSNYGKEYPDLNSALQGAAAELADNEPCQDCYGNGLQSGPVDYLVYTGGGCTTTKILTDTTFTNISNPTWPVWPNSGDWGKRYSVHIYGKKAANTCGGYDAHHSTSGAYVYAYPVCPLGYKAFRDEVDVHDEPYGFMCIPSEAPTINDVDISEDTDCHDTSTAGGGSTNHPVDIGKRCKDETVEDIQVAGPWPLSWQRHFNQNRFYGADSNTWMMDERRRLTVTPVRATNPNAGMHTAFIDRRKGHYLTFKAIAVSGGPRTWVSAMAQPGKYESVLEEVWTSGALASWTLHQANGDKEIYSPTGTMVRRTSADGHNHHYSYSGNNIASIRDDFGHTLTFGYNADQGFSESSDYTWNGTGQTGTVLYSPSRAALLEARSVKSVTDGRRTVGYHWTASWWQPTLSSKSFLSDVIHPDGTTTQYNYGEIIEGTSSGPTFLSGVIDEENERFLTYKPISGSNRVLLSEWRGGDATGVGALGRLDLPGSKVIDQDGNEFIFQRKSGFAGNIHGSGRGWT